jgi:SAM-dependent methyltransferase
MPVNLDKTVNKFLEFDFHTVLDIGCGNLRHTKIFQQAGKKVTATDYKARAKHVVEGDYLELKFEQHDAVWVSHVLEHQLNVNLFLKKMVADCKEGGVIAISVPPLKHEIVGGHVSLWNAGLLLYNLILAGIDCSAASVASYGYNHSVIVRKQSITLPRLKYDIGDIDTLSKYFPMPVRQGFNGKDLNINWS